MENKCSLSVLSHFKHDRDFVGKKLKITNSYNTSFTIMLLQNVSDMIIICIIYEGKGNQHNMYVI